MAADTSGNTPLHIAAYHGHQQRLTKLLASHKYDVNCVNSQHTTPLHFACFGGHIDTVRTLLCKFGADINARGNQNETPLDQAALGGHTDVVCALITEFGCIPQVRGFEGRTLLHHACQGGHLELVEKLLSEFKLDPMAVSDTGDTPLHIAALAGQKEVVRELITRYKCPVDCRSSRNKTPLHEACYGGHLSVVRMLLLEFVADVNSRDNQNETPLNWAALGGHTDVVCALITKFGCSPQVRGFESRTLLHDACEGGHLELVEKLVSEFKLDPMAVSDTDDIPLHIAALRGQKEIVRELITRYKCPVDCRGSDNDTPLHKACYGGHLSVVRMLLLEFGADVDSRNSENDTPLNVAAFCGHTDVVCALITDFGCSPQVKGFKGITLIHQACGGGHLELVEKLVSEFKLDPMAVSDTGNTPLHIAALCGQKEVLRELITRYKCPVDCRSSRNRTPLHEACYGGHLSVVRMLLLEFVADVNSRDSQNETPLYVAALGGHTDVVCALITEFGCSPQVRGFEGRTLLHQACQEGHSSLIDVLHSEFGLSLLSTNKNGNTPLHIASMFSQPSAVEKLLFEHNAPLFVRNKAGWSPVDVAKGNEVVSLFKKYRREKSSRIQSEYEKLQSIAKKRFSGRHALTRIFVVGYPWAGKSSLIEALKREGLFYSIFARTSRLSEADVPPHTAGIVPSVYTSSQYGRVVFYDFAGDPEYYSSHAAVLESLVSPGCNLFFTVVDLSEEKEVMTQKLGYWLSFISFHSKSSSVRSEVVVMGSHVDIVVSHGQNPKDKMHHLETIATKFCKQTSYMKLNPGLSLDCCRPTTNSMSNLRKLLKKTYTTNKKYVLSLGATIILGLLERDFSNVTACQVSTILNHIQQVGIHHLISMQQLYPVLKELHYFGLLIVVGSTSDPGDHWLLLNISALTEEVHKKLFAKDSLVSQSLADSPLSTLGIIPESVLTKILPEYITKECLKQLQYCQELKHIEIGNHHSIVPVASASDCEPLLFFPALLQNERDVASLATPQGQHICSRGWYIKCTGEFDYFSPRFLHVLLLRLAFSFAEQSGEQPSAVAADIGGGCSMWKSGICWLMEEGVECVVEVVKEREVYRGVVVVARSEEDCDVECASVFAAVVQKVMEAKTEFCHSITTETFLIDPDELNQSSLPSVTELHRYAMCEVERVLVEGANRVRCVCRRRFLDPKKLRYMKCCTYWSE